MKSFLLNFQEHAEQAYELFPHASTSKDTPTNGAVVAGTETLTRIRSEGADADVSMDMFSVFQAN
jgi:hypothetical protein